MTGRVVILGGGITGLAAARMLEPYFDDIVIIERNSKLGGLCMSEHFDGVAVDICGGHIFGTKDNEVRDFVFSIMPKCKWVKSDRNAKIFMEEKFIGFPFENHMFQIGEDFANTCVREMKCSATLRMPKIITGEDNWEDYLLDIFGQTACEKYYFPYNRKVWQYPLDKIHTGWINRYKIPVPNIKIVEQANKGTGALNTEMTHASFYYPKHGGIQSFLESLYPKTATVFSSYDLYKLYWNKESSAWTIWIESSNQDHDVKIDADYVVSTIPANTLLNAMGIDFPRLPYHGTDILVGLTDFFTKNKEISWTYFPEEKYWWHKMTHLAYLTGEPGEHAYALVDAPGGSTLKKDKVYIPGYKFVTIANYQHAMTYPIEPIRSVADMNKLHTLLDNLSESGVFSIGRWGRHRYSNMDICIKEALNAKREIVARL